MDVLEYLKSSLERYGRDLVRKQAEKQRHLRKASKISEIYDLMAENKALIKRYRDSVSTFRYEQLDNFKGMRYATTYRKKMQELVQAYDTIIKNIDINLDRLNDARKQCENDGFKCDGPIGYLESAINSARRNIQNWVN